MNTPRRAFLAAFACAFSIWPNAAEAAETFAIDPVHSGAVFRVMHLKVSPIYGIFSDVSGTVALDSENGAHSKVSVKIAVESLDTGNEKRDEHLEGPDFFNRAEFPFLTFESTKIRKTGGNKFELTGPVTIRGVSKEITASFQVTGTAKGPKGELRKGGETVFVLKRSDFGIHFMPEAIGDEVEVRLAVQGILQPETPPAPAPPS